MSHFTIKCRNCGVELKEVFCAFCEHCKDALLVTSYREKYFRDDKGNSLWRFNWLLFIPLPLIRRPASVSVRRPLEQVGAEEPAHSI